METRKVIKYANEHLHEARLALDAGHPDQCLDQLRLAYCQLEELIVRETNQEEEAHNKQAEAERNVSYDLESQKNII